mmetsp:Transcript_29467/g.74025  ORF Transcript_29467/g.74025 Transcript_29467/m.74025 type:complete len:212 (-) Transcript_29467:796-1431(-)
MPPRTRRRSSRWWAWSTQRCVLPTPRSSRSSYSRSHTVRSLRLWRSWVALSTLRLRTDCLPKRTRCRWLLSRRAHPLCSPSQAQLPSGTRQQSGRHLQSARVPSIPFRSGKSPAVCSCYRTGQPLRRLRGKAAFCRTELFLCAPLARAHTRRLRPRDRPAGPPFRWTLLPRLQPKRRPCDIPAARRSRQCATGPPKEPLAPTARARLSAQP